MVCSISPAMASGSDECQFAGCDSMTRGNGLPSLYSAGAPTFGLERRCRYAALPSHGISSAARRARANAEARGCGPSSAGRPAQAADNPHIGSGKSRVSRLRAEPLPSSGRTHLPVRLTVGDPRLLTRFCAEMASSAGMPARKSACCQEIRAGYQRMIHPECCGGDFRTICN